MMSKQLLALYGLKYNPFLQSVPTEALYVYPKLENFIWRIEHNFIHEGGFALLGGESGTGKSAALRILSEKLSTLRDVRVGVITHPSGRLSDFYRELGDMFGVPLQLHNRWHAFKQLRERWVHHLETTLIRPILFIDEAQEMQACVLNELRLLTSQVFDSRLLMSVILAGDQRLQDKLRRDDLVPLGNRIRVRFTTEHASSEHFMQSLKHSLSCAGSPHLMTQELMQTLCEHAMGNYKVLCNMADTLLSTAAQKEQAQLDEKLYFECFSTPSTERKRK